MKEGTNVNIVTLAVSHLKNIIDKLGSFKEEDLAKLDSILRNYAAKRKDTLIQTNSLTNALEAQLNNELAKQSKLSDYARKELEIMLKNFEHQRSQMQKQNQGLFEETEDFEHGSLAQLCKNIIEELSAYRNVSDYWAILLQRRKETGGNEHSMIRLSITQYLDRFERIVDGNELQFAEVTE